MKKYKQQSRYGPDSKTIPREPKRPIFFAGYNNQPLHDHHRTTIIKTAARVYGISSDNGRTFVVYTDESICIGLFDQQYLKNWFYVYEYKLKVPKLMRLVME